MNTHNIDENLIKRLQEKVRRLDIKLKNLEYKSNTHEFIKKDEMEL